MIKNAVFSRFAKKVRIPAEIVHIAFPLLCWVLVAFSWCKIWLTEPWMLAITVFYYALAAAYLFSIFITRMRITAIVGLFLALLACLFIWIPYNWMLAVLLVPAMFMAFYNRGSKKTFPLTILTGIIVLFIVIVSLKFNDLAPEKYAYHPSPDGRYVALEHEYQLLFFGGTDVLLCRSKGPLLVQERVLYLGDHIDFGGKIEWLDQSILLIYDWKMDVFKDPVIENYTPF